MNPFFLPRALPALAAAALLALAGCTAPPAPPQPGARPVQAVLYKEPLCGCCTGYARALQQAGFAVTVQDTRDLAAVKARLGVPAPVESCHTVEVAGYFVEGHVPIASVQRLLRERPAVDGIALAGMPAGSPGMPGAQKAPFTVHAVSAGQVTVFETR